MNILVRLDISKDIGTGHYRRICNLADYMTKDHFIYVIITDDDTNIIFKNREVVFVNQYSQQDVIQDIVSSRDISLIILDLLHYESNYIKQIKKVTKTKIVSFHEYDDTSKYSDIKINFNFFNGFDKIKDVNFLAGPKYVIFNEDIDKNKKNCDEDYIFVSFGGSDPSDILRIFIKKIAKKLSPIQFKIHIGDFNKFDTEKDLVSKNIEILERPVNLFDYMVCAKLAITSAGNMMYELMYYKIPSLVIAHNIHQDEFAKNASKSDCINYLGLADNINYDGLINTIQNSYIKNTNAHCKQLIDNLGKARISKAIQSLVL